MIYSLEEIHPKSHFPSKGYKSKTLIYFYLGPMSYDSTNLGPRTILQFFPGSAAGIAAASHGRSGRAQPGSGRDAPNGARPPAAPAAAGGGRQTLEAKRQREEDKNRRREEG